jgi:hypothetical protein
MSVLIVRGSLCKVGFGSRFPEFTLETFEGGIWGREGVAMLLRELGIFASGSRTCN